MTAILHYLYDPLCGWCYGAAPMIAEAAQVPGLTLALHAGGMLMDAQVQRVTPAWRAQILEHDRHIAERTGQPFGEAYRDGLLADADAVFDSAPPISAILAADALGVPGLRMLHALQIAHFQRGERIADAGVLRALAESLGLDGEAFAARRQHERETRLAAHVRDSRALLARAGTGGFPTLILQRGERGEVLDTRRYFSAPAQLGADLRASISAAENSAG